MIPGIPDNEEIQSCLKAATYAMVRGDFADAAREYLAAARLFKTNGQLKLARHFRERGWDLNRWARELTRDLTD